MPAVSQIPYRAKHVGVCPPARGAVIAALVRARPAPVWVIVAEHARLAGQLAEDIPFFLQAGDRAASPAAPTEVLLFPESMPDAGDMREAFAASAGRLAVLSALRARRSAGERAARGAERETEGRPPLSASGVETPFTPHSALHTPQATPRLPPPASRIPHSAPRTPPPLLILATPAALLQPVPAVEQFAAAEFTLARGQNQPFQGLLEKLRALDYDSEAVCETPGQYAVRGGIIDVYPVTATQPYRLDFFGDEIEDIRAFDPVTQRSGERAASVTIAATPRIRLDPARAGLADYLPARAAGLLLVEPAALDAVFSRLARETPATGSGSYESPHSISDAAAATPALAAFFPTLAALLGVSDLDEAAALFDTPDTQETLWDTESLAHHRNYPSDGLIANERLQAEESARARFLAQAAAWSREGYALAIVTARQGEENRAKEILAADPALKKLRPRYLRGTLNEGFRITRRNGSCGTGHSPVHSEHAQLAHSIPSAIYITETELFGRQRPRRPATTTASPHPAARRAQVDQLLDFSELVEGDHVVHLQHGIALYRGLAKIEHAAGTLEAISLEFADGVTLHVPLQESHLVSRYVGLAKTRPQLGRIGSGRWEKTRRAAELATLDLAAELLHTQASRETRPGHAFDPDNDWQKTFEASFPHTETRDQLRAIAETKADMERPRPMDRLICGDVGFGKTEIALRAAFKAVQSSRQVALLVPTTILAQQHLNTFRERMAGYPVNIELLSRFRTRAEQKKILAATAAGQVDILIGTHRILQKDIRFRALGLLIIDEEQRFGVKHKETLKTLRATVDILSMSATPIPRTLYLAMTGARDMSIIETAPSDRHPIQTLVKTYDEKTIIEAVRREVRRGGQVFYLHNRVQTIDRVAARLRALLPDLDIGVGHGQMDEKHLERVMTDFVAGRYHILVCTTIIESGLDIPNCNTIIIEGADRFGLSQLYQLRGRVGRFKHQAYACLLLHRHTRLVELTRQRLNALRAHNQLGAGFRIAMRDLELRGAGNLLGPQQSGHIAGVGFELYCQLLRQSVARLKGETHAATIRATVKLDFVHIGEPAPAPTSPTPATPSTTTGATATATGTTTATGAITAPGTPAATGIPATPATGAIDDDTTTLATGTPAAATPPDLPRHPSTDVEKNAPPHAPAAAGTTTPQSPLSNPHSTIPTPHLPLRNPHSPSPTPHFSLPAPQSPLRTPHSALRIPHSSYAAIKTAEDAANGNVPLAPIPARIPISYIAETRLRLDLYRRLALTGTPAALKEIEADLRDRFGPIPQEVRALLLVTEIRIRAEQKHLLSVETENTRLKCLRNTGKHDDYIMHGARFPRLAAPRPLARLREIITFLNNQPTP